MPLLERADRRIFAGARLGSRMVGLAQIIPFGEGLGGSDLGCMRPRHWAVPGAGLQVLGWC
jgi:hypothetical protein